MVYKCSVTNDTSGYTKGLKKPLHFPEYEGLKKEDLFC